MNHFVVKSAWIFWLVAIGVIGNGQARAASASASDRVATAKVGKKTSSRSGSSGQIRFLSGSEETAKERSSRLKRECKGRVNAGACAGYTN